MRKQLREFTGLPNWRILDGLKQLSELEEVIPLGGGKQGARYSYRLAGDVGSKPAADPLLGLTTPDELARMLAAISHLFKEASERNAAVRRGRIAPVRRA
jgi:hypothetical protein